jgi:gp32 DNA binding protein like
MSNFENEALEAMLSQYDNANKPKYEKSEKTYDLKNYFNTILKDGVKSGTKTIRILPASVGATPFVEVHGHKTQIDGDWKTLMCPSHEDKKPCPFCEARQALLATGKESDKELAKKYNAKKMYVVKVIDRDNEADGVKFWRINHDFRKEGVYDKIIAILNAIKKDITHAETGRDLVLTINRNQNNVPIVSGVASLDPSPLSTDAEKAAMWLDDKRTWRDVYPVKSYDYLEIIVKGGVPVWNAETKSFVDKQSVKKENEENKSLDSELTMGVENVKSNVKTATTTTPVSTDVEDEGDDLPF